MVDKLSGWGCPFGYAQGCGLSALTKIGKYAIVVINTKGGVSMADEKKSYNVAFVYTKAMGGYEGVVTWTSFKSKEDFDKWYTDKIKATQTVVEEGISPERAIELANRTPRRTMIRAAIQEATGPDGRMNPGVLSMELQNVLFAERFSE